MLKAILESHQDFGQTGMTEHDALCQLETGALALPEKFSSLQRQSLQPTGRPRGRPKGAPKNIAKAPKTLMLPVQNPQETPERHFYEHMDLYGQARLPLTDRSAPESQ